MTSTTSQTPIPIAIIGMGIIGPRHAEAIGKDRDARLLCIVDPDQATSLIAQRYGVPRYTTVKEMLSSTDKPVGALVCTPNHTHVSVSKELLAAGVHVLCEKPISIDGESGAELIECARLHGRRLLIGHHRRFNQYVKATKEKLPDLGRIIALNGLWTIHKPTTYFDPPTEWRRLNSAGPVFINLIHEIDLLHYFFGPITRVYAEVSVSQRGFDAEEGAAITLKFSNGIVGTFLLSDAVVSPHNFESGTGENPIIPATGQDFYRIFGSEGSLSVPDMITWRYPGKKSWNEVLEKRTFDLAATKAPFELQIAHFVRVIRDQEAPSCSGAEGLRAVLVCEAIKRSMREHIPVDIDMLV